MYYVINITDSNNNVILPSDSLLGALKIQFFTAQNGNYIEYQKSDLVDNVLRVNAVDLDRLADGPVRVRFLIGLNDDNYADGSYDISAERLTGYFLKTIKQKPVQAVEPIDSSINENDTEGGE